MSVDYLKYDEFRDIGENLEYGQKMRINHESPDCQGGSKSLLIERKDNGDISAYCFRCCRRGYYYSKFTPKSKSANAGSSTSSKDATGNRTLPPDAEGNITEWPSAARVYFRQYEITDKEIQDARIRYSSSLGSIIIPVYDDVGLASYQTRAIPANPKTPKYLSVRNRNSVLSYGLGRVGGTIVLVEDAISGIKVARLFPTLVLGGTSLQSQHLDFLMKGGWENYVLFLDDDNATVQKNTLKIKRTLDKVGKCTIVHSGGKDPKEHTMDELEELLT